MSERVAAERIAPFVGAALLAVSALWLVLRPEPVDLRALREAAAKASVDALVVVDDVYGEHLGEMLEAPAPVFMVARDLERHARALPCTGDVFWLTKRPDRPPGKLRALARAAEHDVVGGARLVVLTRADAKAGPAP